MDNRLIVKFKLPASGSGARFVCPTCNKSFTTGKGLGGHKRVHLPPRITTGQPSTANNGDTTFDCPVCSQSWPSKKSLYGHMRKHRDRPWRGMVAPTPALAPAPLLAIENGDSQVASDVQTSERELPHGKAPVEYDLVPTGEPSKQKKKQRLEVGSSSTNASGKPEKKFVCTICDKKFKTYQALGGHTSHHVQRGDLESKPNETTRFSFDLNELPPPEERGDGSW